MLHVRFPLPIFIVFVLALVVAACGDSKESDSKSDNGSASTTSSIAAEKAASQAKHGIKEIINSIEACAAMNADGSYTGCTDKQSLAKSDPSLEITDDFTIKGVGSNHFGFEVAAAFDGTTFTERHDEDGMITKTCSPKDAPGCDDGSWG